MSNIQEKLKKSDISEFSRAVYEAVSGIPEGKTMTYAQVAAAAGRPKAVRAVGNILNKNPFAPEVPCHRVIRSDGSVGGFARGPKKKKALLEKEGALS